MQRALFRTIFLSPSCTRFPHKHEMHLRFSNRKRARLVLRAHCPRFCSVRTVDFGVVLRCGVSALCTCARNQSMEWIDFRSDTVTVPTPEMRESMSQAEVGDDVWGDDPSVKKLEEEAAILLGKEAALFVPSGTMGNLVAVMTHCKNGDEMILGDVSHMFLWEGGGSASIAGVHPRTIPVQEDGTLQIEDIETAIRWDDDHFPRTRLICLENTQGSKSGAPLSAEYIDQVAHLAKRYELKVHVDGARLFHAATALDQSPARLVEGADSVSVCLSKGLCAPIGSILVGSKSFIREARRNRKRLGGGMRQVGVLAAPGRIAINVMSKRLVEDHKNARYIAERIAVIPHIEVNLDQVRTNMIYFRLCPSASLRGEQLVEFMKKRGILLGHSDKKGKFRLVCHYYIDRPRAEKFVDAMFEALSDATHPIGQSKHVEAEKHTAFPWTAKL